MSLLVWLPMTKDLSDQGLGGCTITNDGATLDNNGKLGKCYNFNGTTNRIKVSGLNNPKNITIAFWMKRNATTGTRQFLFTAWNGVSIELGAANNLFGKVSTSSGEAGGANGGTITADSGWIHVCYTFEDKVGGKMYVNGELTGSGNTASSIAWNVTDGYIGNYSNINYNGKMNDFRIYDHALSPKEIEILSRGLVCHYPLCNNGNGQANLLKNSNFTEGSSGSQGYNFSATWTKQTDCMKITSTSAAAGLYTANYDSVTTGDMATFSAYVKADASMTIYIGVDGSGIGNCESFTVGTSWQRISISKAKTTNNANLRVYGNGTFYVRHMKYELGSIVTPWMPNPADAAYTAMGYNSTTEYDVSGYGYNGTKNETITYSSNTARYSVSTVFDGNSASIQIPNLYEMLGSNNGSASYSISVWTYKSRIGSKAYQTILGGGSGFEIEARNASGNDPEYVLWSWGKLTAPYEFNKWNHMVFTKQGSEVKLYVNGVLANQGTSSSAVVNTNYFIGAWNTATQQNYDGQMSDFRIYATALSATQVAELYNTAVSVANNGTLMGYELVEG